MVAGSICGSFAAHKVPTLEYHLPSCISNTDFAYYIQVFAAAPVRSKYSEKLSQPIVGYHLCHVDGQSCREAPVGILSFFDACCTIFDEVKLNNRRSGSVRTFWFLLLYHCILVTAFMANTTTASYAPPPPVCTLTPQPPLVPWVSDHVLGTVLPTLVYIVVSGFFYWLGEQDLLSQYRIHPSQEELRRNRVTRFQCLRAVVRYHVMQIATGLLLSYGEGPELTGNHSCDVYRWAVRVRYAQRAIPWVLALVGVDAKGLALSTYSKSAGLAQLLGGNPMAFAESNSPLVSGFSTGELLLADLIVSYAVPAVQFLVALSVVDTWIYFTHRLCHVNKTLYRMFQRSYLQSPFSYRKQKLRTSQVSCTHNIISSMYHMHMELCMVIGWKAFFSTS